MTDNDLSMFSVRSRRGAPAPAMPDPEPELLARAQRIINETGEGVPFSTLGSGPENDVEVSEGVTDITAAEKLEFLAHLLGGKPIERKFTLFGGRLQLVFSTVSAETEQRVSSLLRDDEAKKLVSVADRRSQYALYMLAASLRSVITSESKMRMEMFAPSNTVNDHRDEYKLWLSGLSGDLLRVIQACYKLFRDRVRLLLDKAEDASFWPTPS